MGRDGAREVGRGVRLEALHVQREGNRKWPGGFGKQQAESCWSVKARGDSGVGKTQVLELFLFLKIPQIGCLF